MVDAKSFPGVKLSLQTAQMQEVWAKILAAKPGMRIEDQDGRMIWKDMALEVPGPPSKTITINRAKNWVPWHDRQLAITVRDINPQQCSRGDTQRKWFNVSFSQYSSCLCY